jgi:Phage integrase, N-terminal SAM-like domain
MGGLAVPRSLRSRPWRSLRFLAAARAAPDGWWLVDGVHAELRVERGRDPITGRRLTKSKAFRGTKGQAERELAAMVAAATEGRLVSSTETVGTLLEEWFAHAEPGFSPKTALETRGILDRYLVPKLGRIRLARLRAAEIDRFYAWLRDERGLAPATVRRVHGGLRRALTQGVKWGKLPSNPAVNASPPRVPAPELSPPEPVEVARLFERAAAEDPRLPPTGGQPGPLFRLLPGRPQYASAGPRWQHDCPQRRRNRLPTYGRQTGSTSLGARSRRFQHVIYD